MKSTFNNFSRKLDTIVNFNEGTLVLTKDNLKKYYEMVNKIPGSDIPVAGKIVRDYINDNVTKDQDVLLKVEDHLNRSLARRLSLPNGINKTDSGFLAKNRRDLGDFIYSFDNLAQSATDDMVVFKDKLAVRAFVVQNPNYSGTIVCNFENAGHMFFACEDLKLIPKLDTSKVTKMAGMFVECESLISVPQLDTRNVVDMSAMFVGCKSLTSVPQLDTSKVTNMGWMFEDCRSLTTIPQLDTRNVTNMHSMFRNCKSLTSIPKLDTNNVTDMGGMFAGCKSLASVPQLDISNVTNMRSMFRKCTKLAESGYAIDDPESIINSNK